LVAGTVLSVLLGLILYYRGARLRTTGNQKQTG
jgi:hypothetical protein